MCICRISCLVSRASVASHVLSDERLVSRFIELCRVSHSMSCLSVLCLISCRVSHSMSCVSSHVLSMCLVYVSCVSSHVLCMCHVSCKCGVQETAVWSAVAFGIVCFMASPFVFALDRSCVCVCVCVRERERERERGREGERARELICVMPCKASSSQGIVLGRYRPWKASSLEGIGLGHSS